MHEWFITQIYNHLIQVTKLFWNKLLYIVATSLSKITLNSILQLLQTECNLSPAMHVWIDLFLNIMQNTPGEVQGCDPALSTKNRSISHSSLFLFFEPFLRLFAEKSYKPKNKCFKTRNKCDELSVCKMI